MPHLDSWPGKVINESSLSFFGKEAVFIGEGGSIPFVTMISSMFPNAQVIITGAAGPNSNPHGPNEFLHIPMVKI